MASARKLVAWLFMLGATALALQLAAVCQFAALREPDRPAAIGEERDLGFFVTEPRK